MNSKVKIVLGLVIVILVIAGAWYFLSKKPVSQVEGTKVRIGYLPILASLPLYVGEEYGYFTDAGIEIEKTAFQTSEQLVDALIRGDIDVVVESSIVPALRVELINPGKIRVFSVSDITNEHPADAILVKKDSTISNISQLSGKKVGVFPGGTVKNVLRKFLESQGVDISKTEFVEIPPTSQLQALSSNAIDALLPLEPTIAIAIESGNYKKIYGSVFAAMLNHSPQGAGLISTSFVAEKPNLAKKTIELFNKANQFIKDNDAKTREIIVEYVKLKPEVANIATPLYMSTSNEINKDIVGQYVLMLVDIGELNSEVNTSNLFYQP